MLNITAARRARKNTVALNIAPLIDMVFILLIFFLVTTSFVRETGLAVSRPTAATAAAQPGTAIQVGISHDNRVYLDRREVDIRALRANVARALAEAPEGSVIIVADRASDTGTVIAVMDACRQAGARQVSLAARVTEGGR
jgi:biopolymer transport protein ExbD